MWPWVPRKLLKWKKQNNILFHSNLILSTFFLKKGWVFWEHQRGAVVSAVNLIWALQFVFNDLQHLLISLERGFKRCYDVELPAEYQIDWIFYKWNIKKTSILSCGRHNRSDVFVLCFYIKDPICLKLVKCFCWYSASAKTIFDFCSCSEPLQLKFGQNKFLGKCKLLSPQDSYRCE